ncbi:MAG: SH3 domain-containing protein [Chloroflexota bacterium]
MNQKSIIALSILLLATFACGFPGASAPTPTTAVTQIIVVIENTPTVTVEPSATSTESPTQTPSPTATLAPSNTPAPNYPYATFIKNANCRSGPSQTYEVVTSFLAGQTVEIVGRNPDYDNTWWQVKIPNSNTKCWVSLTTAQAYGDFDAIPTVSPPY